MARHRLSTVLESSTRSPVLPAAADPALAAWSRFSLSVSWARPVSAGVAPVRFRSLTLIRHADLWLHDLSAGGPRHFSGSGGEFQSPLLKLSGFMPIAAMEFDGSHTGSVG